MKSIKILTILLLVLVALAAFSLLAVAGGSLEPTAPPGPVMKSLDEVEPRIPIHASDLPLTISEPNSYYLVETIRFSEPNTNGITVETSNVTIDLKGYALVGPGKNTGKSGHGIYCGFGPSSVRVFNGCINNWRGSGIHIESIMNRIDDVTTNENGSRGIYVRDHSVVTGCSAYWNGERGIYADYGSVVKNCTALGNGSSGIFVESATIIGCASRTNQGSGIEVGYGCLVLNNDCINNGWNGDGAGIWVIGNRNRIEGNNVADNDRGIDVDVDHNIIIKNSASGNSTNYTIVAGNTVGPIVVGSDPISNTNPWTNFSY